MAWLLFMAFFFFLITPPWLISSVRAITLTLYQTKGLSKVLTFSFFPGHLQKGCRHRNLHTCTTVRKGQQTVLCRSDAMIWLSVSQMDINKCLVLKMIILGDTMDLEKKCGLGKMSLSHWVHTLKGTPSSTPPVFSSLSRLWLQCYCMNSCCDILTLPEIQSNGVTQVCTWNSRTVIQNKCLLSS